MVILRVAAVAFGLSGTGCALLAQRGYVSGRDLRAAQIGYATDTATIIAELGQPTQRRRVVDDPAQGYMEEWLFPDLKVTFYTFRARASAIELLGPSPATARGARVGDPVARVTGLYGSPRYREQARDSVYLRYVLRERGNANSAHFGLLLVTERDTVRAIRLGRLVFIFM